jgi:lactoylglutathione lyase
VPSEPEPGPEPEPRSGAGDRPIGFWHVGITVADIERSLAFYRDGLGLNVRSRARSSAAAAEVWDLPGAQAEVVYLDVPGSDVLIELLEIQSPSDGRALEARPWDSGAGHFCLYVEDLDALAERLCAAGYRTRSGRVTRITDGPLAGARAAYLVDPDGYHVEVFERAPAAPGLSGA